MKAVILAGGYGSRLAEESTLKPKPMVEIGSNPILWHIMKIYSAHGIHDFIICLGYKGYVIKEYFANYFLHMSDITFDLSADKMEVHQNYCEPWRVTLIDTGQDTMTGGRLKRVRDYLGDEDFCFTYGDGVGDIDITNLVKFHRAGGLQATMTVVQLPGRFGGVALDGDRIVNFHEKPRGDGGWINGGFFVLSPKVIDLIKGDKISWEQEPLVQLAEQGQLNAYQHRGFWMPMDTMWDKNQLEKHWADGNAPWKIW